MTNKGCITYANSFIDTSDGNRYFLKNTIREIAMKMFDDDDDMDVKIAVDFCIEEEKTIPKNNIHHYGRLGAGH